jgi:hypothetical protein
MSNNPYQPYQDPNQPPYPNQPSYPNQPPYPGQPGYPSPSEQYGGSSNYYPSQDQPYPPQNPTSYPPAGYPDPTQPAYGQPYGQAGYPPPAQPAPGYPNAGYPNAGYPNQGYGDPNTFGQPQPGANYYAAPPVQRKSHTGRNIVIVLVVLVVIVGGVIGLVSLLHKGGSGTTAGSSYPSYLPGKGSLVLDDTLENAGNWEDTGDGHCVFDNNAFHVRTLSTQDEYNCWSQTDKLDNTTNSAFEAQMKVVQGDCGGLDIRSAESSFSGHHKFYFLSVCDDGNFAIFKYNVTELGVQTVRDFAHSNAIKQGLNVANTIDFVAQGSTLTVFINGQNVASVQDSTLTQGIFGFAANPGRDHVTDASYTNVKIWTL